METDANKSSHVLIQPLTIKRKRNVVVCYYLFVALLLGTISASAQQKESFSLIQFSGVVLASDSLLPIPYAHVYVKRTQRGTISNFQGFFSFVAERGDTVVFSAIGYKRDVIVIPDTLKPGSKYSVIKLLSWDTIHLPATVIYPWPSREQFRDAFLKTTVPADDLERARRNLERERLRELGEAMVMDASENIHLYMQQHTASFYSYKQYPYIGIFDLGAWMRFVEAWKKGEFQRKRPDQKFVRPLEEE